MIAKTSSGPSFAPLAAYLAAGTDGLHPERVEWTAGRNIVTADLEVAPSVMQATAALSTRVEDPVYHVVISFDAGDAPTRAQMEQVGDRVLERLGLAEHQAVLVAHNDTPYAHVHCMVNRVHPETGVAWERWKDRHLIEQALREAERAFGMREVPGRLALALDRQRPMPLVREPGLTRGERSLAQRTHEYPLLDRARAALDDCRAAGSWADLHTRLAGHGLAIERTGQGIVLTDGATRVSASRVAPDLGLPRLEARYAERYPEPLPPPAVERVADALRALSRGDTLERDVATAAAAADQASAQLIAAQVAAQRAVALSQQFTRDLTHVFADPTAARAAYDAIERTQGVKHASAVLSNHPEQLGALKTVDTPKALGLLTVRDTAPATEAARWVWRSGWESVQARDRSQGTDSEARALGIREAAVARAAEARRALAEHRTRHPDRDTDRRDIGVALVRFLPQELRALQRLVSAPEFAVAQSIAQFTRELFTPQEKSRGQTFSGE